MDALIKRINKYYTPVEQKTELKKMSRGLKEMLSNLDNLRHLNHIANGDHLSIVHRRVSNVKDNEFQLNNTDQQL